MRPSSPLDDDGVVDRDVPLPVRLDLERRELDGLELAGEHARDAALQLVPWDRAEKPDAAEVDADHGDPRPEEAVQGPEHRPVAAEHDRDLDVRRRLGMSVARDHELDALRRCDRLEPLRGPRRAPPAGRAARRLPA